MGIFGPSRNERLAAAAAALAPYGFTAAPAHASALRQYEPFLELSQPEHYITAMLGRVEDAEVEAYEYEYTGTDSDGYTQRYDELAVVVRHPWIRGTASFRDDPREWSAAGSILDAFLWVPPFTIVKAVQLLKESRNPDRMIGDTEFDRLYLVHAASNQEAQRAIVPALRSTILQLRFRGVVELRPGVLIYSPRRMRLDAQTAVRAVGLTPHLLAAYAPKKQHPMR